MNSTHTTHSGRDALMAAARARAHELRDQAMDSAWHSMGRAAVRLGHALARHARLRRQAGA